MKLPFKEYLQTCSDLEALGERRTLKPEDKAIYDSLAKIKQGFHRKYFSIGGALTVFGISLYLIESKISSSEPSTQPAPASAPVKPQVDERGSKGSGSKGGPSRRPSIEDADRERRDAELDRISALAQKMSNTPGEREKYVDGYKKLYKKDTEEEAKAAFFESLHRTAEHNYATSNTPLAVGHWNKSAIGIVRATGKPVIDLPASAEMFSEQIILGYTEQQMAAQMKEVDGEVRKVYMVHRFIEAELNAANGLWRETHNFEMTVSYYIDKNSGSLHYVEMPKDQINEQ